MPTIDWETALPNTVFVWSRKLVNPLDLQVADIEIGDIAHSLARQCRYNGHCGGFLSVARHCIWVSDELRKVSPTMELWGLLHDASECYVGDMVSPLKRSEELKSFSVVEDRIHEVIAAKFDLPWPMPAVVNDADVWVFTNRERKVLDTFESSFREDERDYLERFRDITIRRTFE